MKKEFIYLISIAVLFACNNGKHHSAGDKKYQLNNMPVPASLSVPVKYYYTITSEITWQVKIDNKKIENKNRSAVGLVYEISKDSAGNKLITVTYDSLHVYTKNNDVETDADASIESTFMNPVEKVLSLMKGSVIKIIVNNKGKMVDIKGSKELADKIMQHMETQDAHTQEIVQSTINKFAGEEFVKNSVTQVTSIFPDTAIYIGDSWTRQINMNEGIAVKTLTNYTLNAIHNNVAEISADSRINNVGSNAPPEIIGDNNNNTTININGKDESNYSIDLNTGMVLHALSQTSLTGTLQTVIKSDIPVTIKTMKEIIAKKIK